MPLRHARRFLFLLPLLVPLALVAAGDPAPADKALAPKRVTLPGKDLPLGNVLAELRKQTGTVVQDKRIAAKDARLRLDLDGVTFWQAVDAVADQLGAGVSPYQGDGSIALVDGNPKNARVSTSGIFRSAVKRLRLDRDLETGVHSAVVNLEVAWEPWFKPLYLELKSYHAEFARDAAGKALKAEGRGTGQEDVHGRPAAVTELHLPAPKRSSQALARLKGTVSVIGAARLLTVRFDDLAGLARDGKPRKQSPEDGITVTLSKLTKVDTDLWQVYVTLSYPPGGPRFESYQNWLVYNEIYLEKKGKKGSRVRFVGREGNRNLESDPARIRYDFAEEGKGPRLGEPGDWTLVYRTPSRLVEVTAPFDFQDIPLP
jgi:hypothetical protein